MGGFTGGGGADASGNSDKQKKRTSITKKDADRFRKSRDRTRKSVSKSKLDNYELPKSDAPGMLGMALNAAQDIRKK